jgi:hypothetical protein
MKMDDPLAESPACPEWRETEYQSFLRAISWSLSLSLIKPMHSGSACKWLSLRSFALFVAAFAKENSAELPRTRRSKCRINIAPVIQCRHLQKVHYTSSRSGRRICATENQTTDPFILA